MTLPSSEAPRSILIVVDEAAKAARLSPVLAAEGYQLQVVESLTPPLPALSFEPDLGIIWFPYSSPEALPKLENIIRGNSGPGPGCAFAYVTDSRPVRDALD